MLTASWSVASGLLQVCTVCLSLEPLFQEKPDLIYIRNLFWSMQIFKVNIMYYKRIIKYYIEQTYIFTFVSTTNYLEKFKDYRIKFQKKPLWVYFCCLMFYKEKNTKKSLNTFFCDRCSDLKILWFKGRNRINMSAIDNVPIF